MHHEKTTLLADFIAENGLPPSYADAAQRWFAPLAEEIALALRTQNTQVIGVVGSQGSGKSTLAALLSRLLNTFHGLNVAVLSLDDFYHSRDRRQQLSEDIHPLLRTRGVPGTHDVNLAIQTLDALLEENGEIAIPRFDKAADERRPLSDWEIFSAPADLIILEGWCIAARAQTAAELEAPINELEAQEDADGRWRRYVNRRLEKDYPRLFERIDLLIALLAPSFACVYNWRQRQEEQLRPGSGAAIMDRTAVKRFVQHFERITRYNLPLQAEADVVFYLDHDQQVEKREDHRHG